LSDMRKNLDIPCTSESGNLPEYQSEHAAGCDLKAKLENKLEILPGEKQIVPTGIRLEIPEGYEAQIRPRSGLAFRHGITILNAPGTIDSDYRGEVKVILINLGKEKFIIKNGDRIAQMIFAPVIQARFIKKQNLKNTERGEGGFGSTGI
jgi:dUTP pyrophosphatase